jgi:hypothetical protein
LRKRKNEKEGKSDKSERNQCNLTPTPIALIMSVLNPGSSDDDPLECPLCLEYLELDDINFYPCSCGYQVRDLYLGQGIGDEKGKGHFQDHAFRAKTALEMLLFCDAVFKGVSIPCDYAAVYAYDSVYDCTFPGEI